VQPLISSVLPQPTHKHQQRLLLWPRQLKPQLLGGRQWHQRSTNRMLGLPLSLVLPARN
jgi:hypothetical protein